MTEMYLLILIDSDWPKVNNQMNVFTIEDNVGI